MNINDYKGVLVYVEQRFGEVQNVSLELLGKGRKIADELGVHVVAALIGKDIEKHSKLLVEYGADKVLVMQDDNLELYSTEPYTQAMVQAVNSEMPEIVLFGATSIGRDLAPRVSARLLTGLTADCTSLDISEDRMLLMTRPAFGGNIMATIVSPDHRPQMSTVRPGVMTKMERDHNRTGEIVNYPVKIERNKNFIEVLSFEKETEEKQDIQEATVLVSGGRGIGSKDNFGLLYDLADELNGLVSASRAAVDSGWMDHDRQVGQTGKTVRPNLYIACGISGAIQHVAGMEEAELIIAVNKDKGAKIFEVADLGIVGDVQKVLPFVIEEIKKINLTKKVEN
ncbi:electron transfer flavoprotein subunit alpha/FixB family protein [Fusibacter bizertensis]|uniref:Electron transfer flavoprotein subunit alpha/FixB family protein n=1 Tax=Fusibacter bizertensis TaxID=1488331 RepID=A0ABT6NDM6_9FIRM|nr:electron transfer flavoprotein subunit alpha/FixB family protein [Fusibacter bizertensis]MDH8678525.1 electron transfer flavoprotein subunit alpha/FixB family protein [Fusibacter bizertensis]